MKPLVNEATTRTTIYRLPPAAKIRKALADANVLCIRIIGHPGSGKTQLIKETLRRLPAPRRVAAVVVNPASSRDAQRLDNTCGHVAHIDAAVPGAQAIWAAISELKLDQFDIILIEAAGGLAQMQDLGQDATVAVFAVSGGDDKAAEYHTLLTASSAVLLTKTDLLPLVKFDSHVFRSDIRSINSSAEIHEISANSGSGMNGWIDWVEKNRSAKRRKHDHDDAGETPSNTYFG